MKTVLTGIARAATWREVEVYEKGQRLIYLGEWYETEVAVVYFLFKIDDRVDPIHDYIVTRDPSKVRIHDTFRNLGEDSSLIWVRDGSQLRGYSDRTYRRYRSACRFLRRWRRTIGSRSPGPWAFFENEFLVHNPNFVAMRMKVFLKWLLGSFRFLLWVFAVGLLDIFFHDFVSFFRNRAGLLRTRTDLRAAEEKLKDFNTSPWLAGEEKKNVVSRAQEKVSKHSTLLQTLRKQSSESSRGFILLILTIATIFALAIGLISEVRRSSELERRLRRVESFLSLDEMPEQGEPRSR